MNPGCPTSGWRGCARSASTRWAPLAYEEFRLKEYGRDRGGTWVDEIPDGNDHSVNAVRYAMMGDVLRG